MQCSVCRATNPDDARWCNQCYATLEGAAGSGAPVAGGAEAAAERSRTIAEAADAGGAREAAEASPAEGAAAQGAAPATEPLVDGAGSPTTRSAPAQDDAAPAETDAGSAEEDAASSEDGAAVEEAEPTSTPGFRKRGDVVEWACPRCGGYTSVERPYCDACHTPMAERFAEPAEPEPPRPWGLAVGLSALAPGAGHLLVERHGSGAARLLLFLVWGAGGIALLAGPGPGLAVALPAILGAAVVWLGSIADVLALQHGGRQMLAGRMLLWLVVGVTGLIVLGAAVGATTAAT